MPKNFYIFTLDSVLQGTLQINDPVGWEELEMQGKRDSNTHGVFFDISGTTFKFWGAAFDYLMTAFDTDGIEAGVSLLIEETCDGGLTFTDFFFGQLDFTKKVQEIGATCYFICPVAEDGCLVKLKNNIDQKVEIPGDYDLRIFAKDVLKYGKMEQVDGSDAISTGVDIVLDSADSLTAYIYQKKAANLFGDTLIQDEPISINNVPEIIDIGSVYNETTDFPDFPDFATTGTSEVVETFLFEAPVTGEYTFKWDFNAEAFVQVTMETLVGTGGGVVFCGDGGGFKVFKTIMRIEITNETAIDSGLGITQLTCQDDGLHSQSIHWLESGGLTYNLFAGSTVKLFIAVLVGGQYYVDAASIVRFHFGTTIQVEQGSYFDIKLNDIVNYPSSLAEVSFADTAFNTAVREITGDCVGFKSEFFGRTDGVNSEAADGCGGLNVVTNGLKIRQLTPDRMALSAKYLFDNFSAIYNLGMGVEIIGGDKYLRVEEVLFFYKSGISVEFSNIADIKIKFDQALANNSLGIGYNKWESEGASGLDDIMTKRQFSTPLTTVNGDISKYSDIIASTYSIEATRRQIKETKDFKYDNNTFVIITKRNGAGEFTVDRGNITNDANIIEPGNGYNYAITPARNAMRWFKTAMVGVKVYMALLFKYGEGNYIAESELTSGCSIEDNTVVENDSVTVADIIAGESDPLYSGELIEFSAPMDKITFDLIEAAPYDKIGVSSTETDFIYGWLKNIDYNKKEHIAKFTLLKEI